MIICYGDSNTYGYDPADIFGGRYKAEDRWPDILASLTGDIVINYGLNGREIPHYPRSIQDAVNLIRSRGEAETLIIMLGTNDILCMPDASADGVSERMDAFLGALVPAFPSIRFLLVSPPGFGLNTAYKKIAEKYAVIFADSNLWNLPLAFDGIHFTPEANRIFAQNIYAILNA